MNPRTTNKYVNIKYNPVGKSREDGLNCLTIVTDWLIDVLDSEFRYDDVIVDDITWDNVKDRFDENPVEVFNKVEGVLLKYLDVIDIRKIKRGDLLAVRIRNNDIVVPAVYVGMGKIMVMTVDGSRFYGNRFYKIEKAYRKK